MPPSIHGRERLAVGIALALFTTIVIRTAWLSDDAFITFRTIDNFVNGHGLTWNVAERVQVYTHPLWMLVLSALYAVTDEIVITAMTVSVVLSTLAAAALGVVISRDSLRGGIAVVVLALSRPFVDYSTSGLEAPLTHVLLGGFLIVFFGNEGSPRWLGLLSLFGGLLACNRMDTILLVLPAMVWAWWRHRGWRSTGYVVLGSLPFLAWLVFSLAYYGFPFPNTAYAKLATGIPAGELAIQGLWYVANLATRDPLTLVVLVVGMAVPVLRRDTRRAVVATGALIYCLYIVRIGGDFMSGRLFTPPMFMAVAVLVSEHALHPRTKIRPGWSAAALATVAFLGIVTPQPTVLSGADFGRDPSGYLDSHGISDERRFYYQSTGLQLRCRGVELPRHPWVEEGRSYRAMDRPIVVVRGSVGFFGFFAGPRVHIIDYLALTDPLLSRFPAAFDSSWRIGHFVRNVPADYPHAVVHGPDVLSNPDIRHLYEKIWVVTRGPIWSSARWRTILEFNLGRYDHLVDWDRHRFANIARVSSAEVALPHLADDTQTAHQPVTIGREGLHIGLPERTSAAELEIGLTCDGACSLLIMDRDEVVRRVTLRSPSEACEGFAVHTVRIPSGIASRGYTAVRLVPVAGDQGEVALVYMTVRRP